MLRKGKADQTSLLATSRIAQSLTSNAGVSFAQVNSI
jgi:hypothetical protein